jgi:hypothetical protein
MSPKSRYQFNTEPIASPGAVAKAEHSRFTVLTDGLIRCEWACDGSFEDRASAFAVNRKLAVPSYHLNEHDGMEIVTKRFHLSHNGGPFSTDTLSVRLCNGSDNIWRFGDHIDDLGGTVRTLDRADGRVDKGHGIISRAGFGILNDRKSMLFENDGWVGTRRKGLRHDFYLFCYGNDYRAAVKAYYRVSGSQPLLPRYALGNWWTRYYPYTQQEYLELMDHFRRDDIPMAVSVLDMHWHRVNLPPGFGSGWGGYNWNKELIPDPVGFLTALRNRGLRTTLNDHPADGIRWWDDRYDEACNFLGLDPQKREDIQFDSVSKVYINAYFDIVLHGFEDQGIDFWWIDWQAGEHSRIPGIDPLWMLNHYHFLNSSHSGRRPLILSRFAGPGSQRYPLGFSGDVAMTWPSLDFQPEFTATASNIGYAWWSHDIGGHMGGYKDDECTTRWYQLGCWSPIFRLHCSNSIFNFREPWKFNAESCAVMEQTMRLRHKLIPYIYTMNTRSAVYDEPLICPLYWEFPGAEEAYNHPNQYLFGNQLIVAPITRPRGTKTHLASVDVWLPAGRFVDIFTGLVYDGDRELRLHRSLKHTPVFAREGAIVPLDGTWPIPNGCPNPATIELLLVVGKSGHFDLVEDDGTGSKVDDGDFVMIDAADNPTEGDGDRVKFATTHINYDQPGGLLTIEGPAPPTAAVPSHRKWIVRLVSHMPLDESISCTVGNKPQNVTVEAAENDTLVTFGPIPTDKTVQLNIGLAPQTDVQDASKRCWDILFDANDDHTLKEAIWDTISGGKPLSERVEDLKKMDMAEALRGALLEPLLADKRYHNRNEGKDLEDEFLFLKW